jgi:hypothetical protein
MEDISINTIIKSARLYKYALRSAELFLVEFPEEIEPRFIYTEQMYEKLDIEEKMDFSVYELHHATQIVYSGIMAERGTLMKSAIVRIQKLVTNSEKYNKHAAVQEAAILYDEDFLRNQLLRNFTESFLGGLSDDERNDLTTDEFHNEVLLELAEIRAINTQNINR